MPIKKKDFIELDYTGKLKENGEVFDTTVAETAKKSGIHSPKTKYGFVTICVGEGMILHGLEKKIEGKEIGKHTLELSAPEAFGNKEAKNIQMIPAGKFREQKIQPFPGLQLNIDGLLGTVKTAGGGRVLVDFNHPLAGKEVVYELDIKRIVTDPKEKIVTVVEMGLNLKPEKVEIEGDSATITLDKPMPAELAEMVNRKIIELCGVKAVAWKKSEGPKDAAKDKKEKPAKPE